MTPSPLDVARSISNRECPVKGKVDLVVLGKALRAAIAVGYVRADHGCFDDWGGYSVTRAGMAEVMQRTDDDPTKGKQK